MKKCRFILEPLITEEAWNGYLAGDPAFIDNDNWSINPPDRSNILWTDVPPPGYLKAVKEHPTEKE